MNATEQKVFTHVEPIAKDNDLKLVEVNYVKEGPDFFLRIFLDKKGGISLDDCAAFSEIISAQLDEWDIIGGAYYLDVSSPGRSEEHTSELQSRFDLVCRLLLEK